MESLGGFSLRRLLNVVNFNPSFGFPDLGNPSMDIKLTIPLIAIQRYAPRLITLASRCDHAMLAKPIGHTRVRIRSRRRIKKTPLQEKWIGKAEVEDEMRRFTTDQDEVKPGKEYHVVYEKTEIVPGEPGIKIHDLI